MSDVGAALGIDVARSRVSAIEARLGTGRSRGVDVRAAMAFEQVLQAQAGRSASSTAAAGATSATTPTGTGALDELATRLGLAPAPRATPAPAPTPVGAAPGGAPASLAGVPYADLFLTAGTRHGVDPALLAAVAHAESGYDPRAVSHAGAEGLMQLMPGTARGLGVTDSFDPVQAVDGAARLLSGHLDRFGSVELALAAYNAGPGAVTRFGGIPPYSETQAYVPKVIARYEELRS